MRVWKRGYDIIQERLSPREGNRQWLRSLLFESLCRSMCLVMLLRPSDDAGVPGCRPSKGCSVFGRQLQRNRVLLLGPRGYLSSE